MGDASLEGIQCSNTRMQREQLLCGPQIMSTLKGNTHNPVFSAFPCKGYFLKNVTCVDGLLNISGRTVLSLNVLPFYWSSNVRIIMILW